MVSDKNFGPFYRIKLKNGKIGYIVDYELDIEGKGRLAEKDFDELMFADEKKISDSANGQSESDEEEEQLFGKEYSGYTLQLLNYHENTMGSDQVANLIGVGYKSVSIIAWSMLLSFGAPNYYNKVAGATSTGAQLWADMGFSNTIAHLGDNEVKFSGGLFSHFSFIQLRTPARNYDLQDVTVGFEMEASYLLKLKKSALEMGVKYYFDKSNYAGLALSYLY